MRKIIHIIVIALALLVLPVVGAVVWLAFTDLSRYQSTVENRAAEAIGRPVAINGDFTVKALPSPQMTATDITIGNNSRIGEFHIEISLWSLLGRVVVNDFVLKDANILWDASDKDGDSQAASKTADKAVRKSAENLPIIRRADIQNLDMHYVDRKSKRDIRGTFNGNINLQGRRNDLHGNINLQSDNLSVSFGLPDGTPISAKGCVLLEAPVTKGIAQLQKAVAVSDKGPVQIKGSVNLAKQTVDASANLMIEQLQTETTIKISGPVSDLQYEYESININVGGLLKGVTDFLTRTITGQASQGGLQACRNLADG